MLAEKDKQNTVARSSPLLSNGETKVCFSDKAESTLSVLKDSNKANSNSKSVYKPLSEGGLKMDKDRNVWSDVINHIHGSPTPAKRSARKFSEPAKKAAFKVSSSPQKNQIDSYFHKKLKYDCSISQASCARKRSRDDDLSSVAKKAKKESAKLRKCASAPNGMRGSRSAVPSPVRAAIPSKQATPPVECADLTDPLLLVDDVLHCDSSPHGEDEDLLPAFVANRLTTSVTKKKGLPEKVEVCIGARCLFVLGGRFFFSLTAWDFLHGAKIFYFALCIMAVTNCLMARLRFLCLTQNQLHQMGQTSIF